MRPPHKPPDVIDAHDPPSEPRGDGWQRYVNRLLAAHFAQQGHTYIAIPDKVSGDGGLEGFSTTGEAFQAYADEDSVSTADRAKKQKRKITSDLKKLSDPKRHALWAGLLQGLKISRWHLVVPSLEDKSVLVHARTKGETLRRAKLAFLSEEFQATVINADSAFPIAARNLLQIGCSFIPDGYLPSSEEDLAAFAHAQHEQIAALDRKLQKVTPLQDDGRRSAAKGTLLRRYLDSENLLARLKSDAYALGTDFVASATGACS
ncbi:MAG: hypothetical protein IPK83_21195 [Planctomycetes bacterium]|nr:hypothetical protein [Planctomycetota bacterium]